MLDQAVQITAIVIGLPVLGGSLVAITALLRGYAIKCRELRLREQQLHLQEQLRQDELNAKILKLDDGVSAAEIAGILEELRDMRSQIEQLQQNSINRIG